MDKARKLEILETAFNSYKDSGIVANKKEFAAVLQCSYTNIIQAFNGDEKYLNDKFIRKVQALLEKDDSTAVKELIPLLPLDSVGGSLTEFNADGVSPSQCEYITSPIKGATFAIRLNGDSMSPDFPNGSTILIKRVQENIFLEWGCPYVLDSENGIVCKIIQPCEDNDDMIECQSINPLFKPFRVAKKYIRGWYRVMMVMSLK